MIEAFMLCAIGLSAGGLMMLVALPMVHARAERLTAAKLLDAMPLAAHEIQADKDHLRAQFAVKVRQLEVSIETMRDRNAGQLRQIGRHIAEINQLRAALDESAAQIADLEAREKARRSVVKRAVRLVLYLSNREQRRPIEMMRATQASMARMAERYAGLISL
jgi:septal ring factor EnvC (AmiA/AmiB activator)